MKKSLLILMSIGVLTVGSATVAVAQQDSYQHIDHMIHHLAKEAADNKEPADKVVDRHRHDVMRTVKEAVKYHKHEIEKRRHHRQG